ncbi:MAG: hypothetical protein KBD06_04140 [Candidatus Pacebacteria bacterium]|nr:hypothetical protein [Candidatus Paceibacterota bacterium]
MQKSLIVLVGLAIITVATSASAASNSYSSVTTSVSGGSSAVAEVNTIMTGGGSNSTVIVNGQVIQSDQIQPPVPLVGKQLPPIPPLGRESNRELINRIRARGSGAGSVTNTSSEIRVVNNVQNINGTTSGEVHIYRKENGKVVEDRTMPIPPNTSGKPFMFRSSTTAQTGVGKLLVRDMMATDSRAMIVREIATSGTLPWLMHVPFFSIKGMGVASTATNGVMMDVARRPFENLFDRVFRMFQ